MGRWRQLLLILFLLSTGASKAEPSVAAEFLNRQTISSYRQPGEDWREIKRRVLERLQAFQPLAQLDSTVFQMAGPIDQVNVGRVQEWKDHSLVEEAFYLLRDIRFLSDPFQEPHFSRRLTWLYPDDGCYARAAVMKNLSRENGYPGTNRVFIFGDLSIKSLNSLSGEVTWWYHTAPIVRVGERLFVFDPSIEPSHPMSLMDWAQSQTRQLSSVKIAICSPETYVPSSQCGSPTPGEDKGAVEDLRSFLSSEWQRQLDLGRNPVATLGDHPPWLL